MPYPRVPVGNPISPHTFSTGFEMLQLVQSRPLTPDDLADPYLLLLDLLAEPS